MGLDHALTDIARSRLAGASERLEERLLAIEGRRGVMGPAHHAFTRYQATGDREVWSSWDWSGGGEEWNESSAWKESLVEHVLRRTMPSGGTILEIGPGAGRWTPYLREQAERLVLVEATDEVLELSRARYGDDSAVSFVRTNGSDLPGVGKDEVDAVWSFDVFVHLAPVDVAGYLAEVSRVLRPGGTATIHHSGRRDRRGWRAPMTARLFANLADERGLRVRRQFDSWDHGRFDVRPFADVITQLEAPTAPVDTA
jgi:ubiquinone/menaquinone biosynthesis C-methylase UbiE